MIDIRKPLPADSKTIAQIVTLATELLRKVYRPNDVASSGVNKTREKFDSLVAIKNSGVVGVIEYKPEDTYIYFQGLAVEPAFRNQGIATKLIETLEEMALESTQRSLKMATIEETGNCRIFEKLGFNVTSREVSNGFHSNDCHPVHVVTMEKNID